MNVTMLTSAPSDLLPLRITPTDYQKDGGSIRVKSELAPSFFRKNTNGTHT